MPSHWSNSSLYGIVDLGYAHADQLPLVTQALIASGAGLIQLRAKGHTQKEIQKWAAELLTLCRASSVPFIINDYVDIAVAIDADGVHLGQDDGSLQAARSQFSTSKIIGRSTHSPEQAQAALEEGADYIGFGPLFPTPTKKGRPGIGLENIATVEQSVGTDIPVYCIGGIKRDNLDQVKAAGARRVVVVSDLLLAEDITSAGKEICQALS